MGSPIAYYAHCMVIAEILAGRANGTITEEEDDNLSELASKWWYLMNEGERELANQWYRKHFPKPHPDTLRLERLAKRVFRFVVMNTWIMDETLDPPKDHTNYTLDDLRAYIDSLEE